MTRSFPKLNAKQKKLINKFISDYHEGSGGSYPYTIDQCNPFLWQEIQDIHWFENVYTTADQYVSDAVSKIKYGK